MPKVSVVMPVCDGAKFLKESIQSIQNQTFTDWEFIIVNEYGSCDGSEQIIKRFAQQDSRIILVQNTTKLGLADSLNVGINRANGEYIARVDVDDPSYPTRLQKQVNYLESNPDVDLCGTLQRSVTPQGNEVQHVPCEREQLKAALLFGCEISHCSVMFRKETFIRNNWRYNPDFLGEDFELWTRIMFEAHIVNLNEVLVDHRWGFQNISISKGERLKQEVREINARTLEYLGIDMTDRDLMLLSGWRSLPEERLIKDKAKFLKDGFQLLEEIRNKNCELKIFNVEALEEILHKRWGWICRACGLKFDEFAYNEFENTSTTPIVTVLMPVYNSAKHLREAIDSVLKQTFTDWEFLVVNEYGSNDGSSEIVKAYAIHDQRFRLIQNDVRLGLGESLNKGMRLANGKYLARLDADDLAHPTRFEKQVKMMEENPNVGVCGTYQHHFGPKSNWVHKPPTTAHQTRANLLFYCDLCHSTLMLRKKVFIENNLFYNNNYLAEDFELWTRTVAVTDIVNIPEVLGEYRWGEDNVTLTKMEALKKESGYIVAKSLENNLKMHISEDNVYLFDGWGNLFLSDDEKKRAMMLERFKEILLKIWETNNIVKFYDKQSLLNILSAKWKWAKYNESWNNPQHVSDINEIFDENYRPSFIVKLKRFLRDNPTLNLRTRKILKKVLKPLINPIRRRVEEKLSGMENRIITSVENYTWDRHNRLVNAIESISKDDYKRLSRTMDARIWELEKRVISLQQTVSKMSFRNNLVKYKNGEKIRIVFLFQVASFWPSLESLYTECLNDNRFEVVLVCYDENIDPSIKVETARSYLVRTGHLFIPWEEFDVDGYKPHVVVLQTPYDSNRRDKLTSSFMKNKGIRTVYIPYGIEIADTEHARDAHFNQDVVKNSWRTYTFSDAMLKEYRFHSDNGEAVKALGLPKFDSLYQRGNYRLNGTIAKRAKGRKIVLWKVHFPKVIKENGKDNLVTPYINEYLLFTKMVEHFSDLFFIFMPHPRFHEFNNDPTIKMQTLKLIDTLEIKENVYIDRDDDYRPSLLSADYIIVDRSAVMIEAAATGVPILYMYNPDFNEPLTQAITPLVESYYQGTTSEDMVNFVEMCKEGADPKKQLRDAAFKLCIPFFDGKCGERIKDDIVLSLQEESSDELMYQTDTPREMQMR
ncbi:bifunctional glycosyltransferase/CDP-glycerol:glycerophosphate glycerophosphotransferase [Paenibacillus ginsengarvi]|uniref:Glycosyltransferase n=1 Tax=Paenibacillus ginsengarvi TaxID=400777 RepID=A0A3B0CCD0_9BACL|nr:glycosyltransferase [Paenibacillus ginsengarvi]RKN82184.1 glycosyltransferase [Paenibacillus ginsengarvi]